MLPHDFLILTNNNTELLFFEQYIIVYESTLLQNKDKAVHII